MTRPSAINTVHAGIASIALMLAGAAWAQPAADVTEIRAEPEVSQGASERGAPKAKENHRRASRATAVALLPPTNDELAQIGTPGKDGRPPRIGFPRSVPGLEDETRLHAKFEWEALADGSRVGAALVTSPNASAIRVALRVNSLLPETIIRFYAPDGQELFEITGEEILDTLARNIEAGEHGADAREYWSPVIESSTVTVEVELPPGARPQDFRVAIPRISHLVISAREDFFAKAASSCNNDATCQTSIWGNEINAVARMVYSSGGFSYLCTGTLLADRDTATAIPYFLSANHCISTQTAASTLQTYWFYRSGTCNGSSPGAYQTRTGGATLLRASAATDVSFLRLSSTPPAGAVYAGWIAGSPPSTATDVTGIHHPTGDLLKISFGDVAAYASCTAATSGQFSCSSATASAATFYAVTWRSGITEPGSSGSAIFQDNGRYLIGHLYGGSSSCSNPGAGDFYGRFDVAYNSALSKWLGVTATPPPTQSFALTVSVSGTGGSGTVTSVPAGINCPGTCSASFLQGTAVSLTATPAALSRLNGWSGACTGTGACNATMNAATSVGASFGYGGAPWPGGTALPANWVSSGSGWSVVTGSAGVDTYEGTQALKSNPTANSSSAAVSYSADFTAGTVSFARRVSSEANNDFLRFYIDGVLTGQWSGEAPWTMVSFPIGTGNHTLRWTYEKSTTGSAGADAAWIDAINLPEHTLEMRMLTVTKPGGGMPVVNSTPAGINCGPTCSYGFAQGSIVSLSTASGQGWLFDGWGGAPCSGTGACAVTLSAASSVAAMFRPLFGKRVLQR